MKCLARGDDPTHDHSLRQHARCVRMIVFVNGLAATIVIYASVTRGALVVAKGLERLVRKPS